jgi:hypothetical protein
VDPFVTEVGYMSDGALKSAVAGCRHSDPEIRIRQVVACAAKVLASLRPGNLTTFLLVMSAKCT